MNIKKFTLTIEQEESGLWIIHSKELHLVMAHRDLPTMFADIPNVARLIEVQNEVKKIVEA